MVLYTELCETLGLETVNNMDLYEYSWWTSIQEAKHSVQKRELEKMKEKIERGRDDVAC